MLKILAVVDKAGTAIDRLAQSVKPYHSNLDYQVIAVHPKRPDNLAEFQQLAQEADIIHFEYFRTAMMLLNTFPWLKDKKKILSHYNPYSINEGNWDEFDFVTAPNQTIRKDLVKIMHNPAEGLEMIPIVTNPYFWQFNFDWKPTKKVLMVANRIEAKKGILEVAIACGELGLTFVLVGAVSDREYLHSILQTGRVEFHEQISDEALRDLYYSSVVHVCNSQDNFESGTMPILEAMQCGTPVLTRIVGHVPDLYDGENLTILEGQPSDVVGIRETLSDMLSDPKGLETKRQKAWNTARNYNPERRAYAYQRLYRRCLEGESVSVIVPVYDRPEVIRACLNAIAEQDYPNVELIVVDDNGTSNQQLVNDFARTVSLPVRYLATNSDGYGLAKARNMGIIEATGDILVFCDQRQVMDRAAVRQFVKQLTPQTWLFGDKGANKTTFVENFSCVARTEIINAGMFNERCDTYGALSQEIRSRTRAQGFRHIFVPEAKAKPMGKSANRNRKKAEIIYAKNWLYKAGL
jgi:glycosyltransferase involved in cell wall biosynthesis